MPAHHNYLLLYRNLQIVLPTIFAPIVAPNNYGGQKYGCIHIWGRIWDHTYIPFIAITLAVSDKAFSESQDETAASLPSGKKHRDKQFVRPMALWPHVVAETGAMIPESTGVFSASPFFSYGPEDLAVLADDELIKRRFVEAFRDCILLQYRAWGDLFRQFRHHPAGPAHTGPLGQTVRRRWDRLARVPWWVHGPRGIRYGAIYRNIAWAPILKRWANADFSVMQPTAPSYFPALIVITMAMAGAAGQKEKVRSWEPERCIAIASVLGDALTRPHRAGAAVSDRINANVWPAAWGSETILMATGRTACASRTLYIVLRNTTSLPFTLREGLRMHYTHARPWYSMPANRPTR
jgi:hypothetical protein